MRTGRLAPDEAPPATDDFMASVRAGYALLAGCIAIFFIWSTVARIESAVIASGTLVLDDRRQVIQHLEGGIVSLLNAKEGKSVKEGEILLELDDMEARAGVEVLANQLSFARAQEARLLAEITGADAITFPDDLLRRSKDAFIERTLNDETQQFSRRRTIFEEQLYALKNREALLKDQMSGLLVERKALERQLVLLLEELPGIVELASRGLVPKQRQLLLEREYAQLEGEIGRNRASEAVARSSLEEASLQILQLQQRRLDEVYPALSDIRLKIADLSSRLKVAKDRVDRNTIMSPRQGVLQNVRVSSLGQVVRPGDLLMELVPTESALTVDANVSVVDVDRLATGLTVEVRFPSFAQSDTPAMFGSLRSISKDRLVDERTGEPYFLARIEVDEGSVPDRISTRLQAGMPADVVIPRGDRTFMEYLVKPLGDAFRRTFREE